MNMIFFGHEKFGYVFFAHIYTPGTHVIQEVIDPLLEHVFLSTGATRLI